MGQIRPFCVCVFLLASQFAFAIQSDAGRQEAEEATRAEKGLPQTVRFSGVLRAADGSAQMGTATVTFALYGEAQGGAPLWVETQNVVLDEQGRYTVLLGSTTREGLPRAMFAVGEARWLGVRAAVEGAEEQTRIQLVSVPYALASGDAQSLGGRPATDFQLTRAAATASGDSSQAAPEVSGAVSSTTNTTGKIAKFTGVDTIGDSVITDSGNKIGIGTASPESTLDVSMPSSDYVKINNLPWALRLGSLSSGAQFIGSGVKKTGADNNYIAVSGNNPNVNHAVIEMNYDGAIRFRGQAHQPDGTVLNLTNSLVLSSNGRVGIKTSSPESAFDLAGDESNYMKINAQAWAFRIGSLQNGTQFIGVGVKKTAADNNYIATSANIGSVNHSILEMNYDGTIAFKQATHQADGTVVNPFLSPSFYIAPSANVGIGTAAPSQKLEVAGTVYSTSGGFKFPDGTVQATAATGGGGGGTITGVTAGTGLTGGGTSGTVNLAVNPAVVQSRVTGTCAAGQYVRVVAQDGSVTCGTDQMGAGTVTSVSAGTGLTGGPITTSGTLSLVTNCGTNQILKWNGSSWGCSDDLQGGGPGEPSTDTFTIPGPAFNNLASKVVANRMVLDNNSSTTNRGWFILPFDGGTVTALRVCGRDNDTDGQILARLYRRSITLGVFSDAELMASIGSGAAFGSDTVQCFSTTSITNPIIDSANYAYTVELEMSAFVQVNAVQVDNLSN